MNTEYAVSNPSIIGLVDFILLTFAFLKSTENKDQQMLKDFSEIQLQ